MLKNTPVFCRAIRFLCLIGLVAMGSMAHAQDWNQIIKRTALDRGEEDEFGYSVAISGDYAIVGARLDYQDADGLGSTAAAGSVYIFKNTAGVWSQQQKLVASDRGTGDYFGHTVSISGDYAIVGAQLEDEDTSGGATLGDAGAAYIFKQTAGVWSEQQKIVPDDREGSDNFGHAVAIDGDYAIVSAIYEDEDAAGGNMIDDAGSAYIFIRSDTTWTQQAKIVASDRARYDDFGHSVAISGDYVIVGAVNEDDDENGANYRSSAGSAYVFKRSDTTWTQQAKIVASDRYFGDDFGYSVAINGDHAIVGAPSEDEDAAGGNMIGDAGSAYIFVRSDTTWTQQDKIVASDRANGDEFGWSVAISGDNAMVGARYQDKDASGTGTLSDAGAAYVFRQAVGTWSQRSKVVASDRASDDQFGHAVAISSNYALAGSPYEDEDSLGNTTLNTAGSVYFFDKIRCTSTAPLPVVVDSTYTSSYTEYTSGWVNYCAEGGELLLSLDTLGTGARVNATEVQLKIGASNTYSYGAAGGMITNPDGYALMDRLWDVSPTTQPSTGNVGVRFYFTDAEYDSVVSAASVHINSMAVASPTTIMSPTNLEFYKSTSGAAFARPHTVSGISLYHSVAPSLAAWKYAVISGKRSAEFLVSSFSGGGGGAGANGTQFPVALLDFYGEWRNASTASLSWRTATEINNSHFILERSTDGQHWEHIARRESNAPNGNAYHIVNYAQLDTDVPATHDYFYYRLVQHDFDGTIAIHDPIVLRRVQGGVRNTLDAAVLYPNPFGGELTIVHAIDEEDVQIEIADALGRVVYTANRIVSHQTIALDHLPAGLYHATISSSSARQVHKIIKH